MSSRDCRCYQLLQTLRLFKTPSLDAIVLSLTKLTTWRTSMVLIINQVSHSGSCWRNKPFASTETAQAQQLCLISPSTSQRRCFGFARARASKWCFYTPKTAMQPIECCACGISRQKSSSRANELAFCSCSRRLDYRTRGQAFVLYRKALTQRITEAAASSLSRLKRSFCNKSIYFGDARQTVMAIRPMWRRIVRSRSLSLARATATQGIGMLGSLGQCVETRS